MFKIGEFSKLTQVSVRMLRYYDEAGLLKPMNVDKFTNYRSYSVEQIETLQKILLLRDMNFPVKEIKEILNKENEQIFIDELNSKKKNIYDEIYELEEKINKIDTAIKDINQNKFEIHSNIIIKNIPSYNMLILKKKIKTYFHESELWEELTDYITKNNIKIQKDPKYITFFYDEEHKDNNVDIAVGVSVNRLNQDDGNFRYIQSEEIKNMASIMVYGDFSNIGKYYYNFAKWLENHNYYKIKNPTRQICHIGPFNNSDPDKYLTELQIPLIKTS